MTQGTKFPQTTIEPQDEALDTFRSLFNIPIYRASVSPDGCTMVLPVKTEAMLIKLEREANRIIKESGLPLEASARKLEQGGYIIFLSLEINYSPSKEPFLCY